MFQNMFDHRGKTTRVIGESRIKIYRDLYNHIEKLQETDNIINDLQEELEKQYG